MTPRARPETARIAARTRELRKSAGMTGTMLAKALQAHGVNWNRTTVAKFETGQRAALAVDELVALAAALHVPAASFLEAGCLRCFGNPPAGFTCNQCGAS